MSTGANPNVQALNDAFDQIDTATTAAGTTVTAVAGRIQRLLDQIAQGGTPAQLQAAAQRAQGDVTKLTDLGTALNGMASDVANPVPTPVPSPNPGPTGSPVV